ncbi:ABC-type bacteriocin/lantibiotic exporter, contains an N-terminal double-glycine peptidase domain [Aquiflexum balticum DSM 16537]|uniref:ABC-type bacteriocin/lantibiotic exporter, contains an N-terminal double-glycine peptidase domain n=1 Tax=Aquiflexum balticum DSM 16537 TaxID=758820 RepID=A0A1W2H4H9_9BACT|nr:ATP-binding cassette domain-containing protein [Aquiflexum balticum]SMD43860.1 ABC-type bacteriocin/lantibiotic exporter, contains an N-terminal double-glycine peptidase domain [Aquiflexum balticum DSM 16537]
MKIDYTLTPLKRFFNLLNEEKKEVYAIYFYSLLNGAVSLIYPLGIQAIVNFVLGGRVSTAWLIMILVVALGITFGGFLQISQLYLTEKLEQRIFTKVGFSFAYRLPKLKLDELQDKHTPELVNRFFDAVNLQKGVSKILIDFSFAMVQIFFGMLLLAVYNIFFLIFSLLLILMIILIFYFTSPKGMETNLKVSTKKYETAYWLEEIGRTLATFKLAGNSKLPFYTIDKLLQSYVDFRNKHFSVLVFQYKVMIAFKALIVTTLLIVGSLLLIDNQISIGQFVAAEVIIILIVSSVEKVILSLDVVYDTLTATEKIGQIMDLPLERQEGTEKSLTTNNESLKFELRNLSFKSKNETFDVVHDVSFTLNPGEKVILTGKSGSGKSTLMYLMSGLFSDYRGRVIVNGLPIDTMNLERLRGYIGDSLSHQSIFHASIYDNITLHKDVEDQHVREIIDLVGLKEYIYLLEKDWDTVLLPEGGTLSKSIVSKIVLARCLVNYPKALLLENMITYLDPLEKSRVLDFILKGNWTVLMISEDADTMRKFPRVIKIDMGNLIFDGSSEEYLNNYNN